MTYQLSDYSLSGGLFDANPAAAPTLEPQSDSLPERVDLRQFCSPVEDQGRTQSCVANAVVAALELQQIKAGMAHTDLSRLFLYYNARKLLNMHQKDGGTTMLKAMAALLAYGCCEEKLWPFDPAAINREPTKACFANAAKFQAVQFARTPNGPAAMSALAEGFAVAFSLTAPLPYYEIAAKTGIMPRPDQIRTPPVIAGHAMLMVGYDKADKTYLVRNSMGTNFGENGYFKIPFETLDVWSMPVDYWTVGSIEKVSHFKLTGPSASTVAQAEGADLPPQEEESPAGGLDKMRSDLRSRLSSDLETSKRDFRSRLRGK
ncbi:MAG: C1 family peptidase [Henriciella sp.]